VGLLIAAAQQASFRSCTQNDLVSAVRQLALVLAALLLALRTWKLASLKVPEHQLSSCVAITADRRLVVLSEHTEGMCK